MDNNIDDSYVCPHRDRPQVSHRLCCGSRDSRHATGFITGFEITREGIKCDSTRRVVARM